VLNLLTLFKLIGAMLIVGPAFLLLFALALMHLGMGADGPGGSYVSWIGRVKWNFVPYIALGFLVILSVAFVKQ
jgi:hypothetical protein